MYATPRLPLLAIRALIATLVWLIAAMGSAQVLELSVEQMGRVAGKIVQGEVVAVQSYWNPERTKIFTEVTVAAAATHKGVPSGSVRILQLGGTVDNVHITVHGALGWTPGEEVLLFLESYRDDAFVVTGHSQGKFHVVRDPRTGEVFVTRSPVADAGAAGRAGLAAPDAEKIPLSRFLDRALGRGPAREED